MESGRLAFSATLVMIAAVADVPAITMAPVATEDAAAPAESPPISPLPAAANAGAAVPAVATTVATAATATATTAIPVNI